MYIHPCAENAVIYDFEIKQQKLQTNSLKVKHYHALKTVPIVISQSACDKALRPSLKSVIILTYKKFSKLNHTGRDCTIIRKCK